MTQRERYITLYEHEKDCNQKMLTMLESVPSTERGDPRFQQAVTLAGHMAACRENWLSHMDGKGENQVAWWNDACDISTLRPRLAALESQWADYLAHVTEARLAEEFEFTELDGETYRVPIEVQIEQLFGHAAYHRGQISLLVDQMGGKTVEMDYVDWWWARQN